MAQVTIYLDDDIARRVDERARAAGVSVSSWVRGRLEAALNTEWPEGYWSLFGSLAEVNLERPEQPPLTDREPL